MKQLLILTLSVVLFQMDSIAQSTDSTIISTLSKPRNITVETSDNDSYTGKVIDISLDYVIMDITSKKHLLVKAPFYIRPVGKYYRIPVEYIRTMYTRKPRRVLKSAAYSGVSGMALAGSAVYLDVLDPGTNEFTTALAAAGVGLVAGAIVGTVTALVVHKKWHINGSSVELAAFRDYYF